MFILKPGEISTSRIEPSGLARQRWEDLPPFSGETPCVKCNEWTPKSEHFSSTTRHIDGTETHYEYLIRTCEECGYEWREHCADHE